MKILTVDAKITCKHITGVVQLFTLQNLVTVEGRPVLVANDPERKVITGCANVGLTIKPCALTLPVTKGYSDLVRINGRAVCLDTVTGFTDGTPPGVVKYIVRHPGQKLVSEKS
ncbi:MAG: hypothetical protein H6667_25170 [Ardenticatenaceae bacterium]|nr:hypothetical protein [Ardenticatenaceae bacterium]